MVPALLAIKLPFCRSVDGCHTSEVNGSLFGNALHRTCFCLHSPCQSVSWILLSRHLKVFFSVANLTQEWPMCITLHFSGLKPNFTLAYLTMTLAYQGRLVKLHCLPMRRWCGDLKMSVNKQRTSDISSQWQCGMTYAYVYHSVSRRPLQRRSLHIVCDSKPDLCHFFKDLHQKTYTNISITKNRHLIFTY